MTLEKTKIWTDEHTKSFCTNFNVRATILDLGNAGSEYCNTPTLHMYDDRASDVATREFVRHARTDTGCHAETQLLWLPSVQVAPMGRS